MKTVQQMMFDDEVMTAFGGGGGGGGGGSSRSNSSQSARARSTTSQTCSRSNLSTSGGWAVNHSGSSSISNSSTNKVFAAQKAKNTIDAAAAQQKANVYSGIAAGTGLAVSRGVVALAPTAIVATGMAAFHQSKADTLNAMAGAKKTPAPVNVNPSDWNSPSTRQISRPRR